MTTTPLPEDAKGRFEAKVRECFGFLEDVGRMRFGGVREVGGKDPRDRSLVARFSRDDLRADIGWNGFERSLAVLLLFRRDDLAQYERHVYLEPFIEFLTGGETAALVPYVRVGMSVGQLRSVMEERVRLLETGRDAILEALGERMASFMEQVESASSDTIREYHRWMNSGGRHGVRGP